MALLIVLAALIMTATSTVLLATHAATIQAQRRLDRCCLIADDVLRAADGPIGDWLAHEADQAVLADDSISPRVDLLHDRWVIGQTDCELTLSAFDQFGMVPFNVARSGSPLRLALPSDVLRAVDALRDQSPSDKFGLDSLVDLQQLRSLSPFPRQSQMETVSFGFRKESLVTPVGALRSEGDLHLGELIATHNNNPVRININTAPMPLVKAAVRSAGRGDVDQIAQARRRGMQAPIPALGAPVSESGQPQLMPEIVARSDCWAFRIDIRVGPVQRSWWAMYQRGERTSKVVGRSASLPTGWRCVQRVSICD